MFYHLIIKVTATVTKRQGISFVSNTPESCLCSWDLQLGHIFLLQFPHSYLLHWHKYSRGNFLDKNLDPSNHSSCIHRHRDIPWYKICKSPHQHICCILHLPTSKHPRCPTRLFCHNYSILPSNSSKRFLIG
jgi:hypothetical protein